MIEPMYDATHKKEYMLLKSDGRTKCIEYNLLNIHGTVNGMVFMYVSNLVLYGNQWPVNLFCILLNCIFVVLTATEILWLEIIFSNVI